MAGPDAPTLFDLTARDPSNDSERLGGVAVGLQLGGVSSGSQSSGDTTIVETTTRAGGPPQLLTPSTLAATLTPLTTETPASAAGTSNIEAPEGAIGSLCLDTPCDLCSQSKNVLHLVEAVLASSVHQS